jgi:hypothetical protein
MSVSPEELKRRAQVMSDAADGKPVQSRARNGGNVWALAKDPVWNWHLNDYRIAPEPAKSAIPRRCVATMLDPWGYVASLKNRAELNGADAIELIELTPEVSAALLAAGIRWEDAPEPKDEELPDWVPPLPLDAVLLGWGEDFVTDGPFQGWAASQVEPEWELRRDWKGSTQTYLYAAPVGSKVALLNGKEAK